ncbi:MarR family winged helix-turn-helix transcriptional regulator [Longispora albida]|uniref:MarR family winged helix-turn-helix transcriptional regulator n=1 Tax=Longispora albida TaxID=203523 RepID=UPI00036B282E|nr:MarR family transcriptional regulator [Longispora albida]
MTFDTHGDRRNQDPGQHPSPIPDPAFYGLIWAGNALTCLVDKALSARHNMPLSWFEALFWLAQQSEPVTATQLGEAAMLSRSRLSRVLDELAARGLITREPSPADARATVVALTPAGQELYAAADETRREVIAPYFTDKLTAAELATLTAIWRKLRT